MRLTEAEYSEIIARRIAGLGSRTRTTPVALPNRTKPNNSGITKAGVMNKTEARFAQEVLGILLFEKKIKRYMFESHTLIVIDSTDKKTNRVRYTPDFYMLDLEDRITFYEVKGFWRAASRIRIKAAAEQYPEYKFVAVQRLTKKQGGPGWTYEQF